VRPAAGDAAGGNLQRREALRLNDRYLQEVVIGFGLCPWAERAITGGQLLRQIVLDEVPVLAVAIDFIDEIARAGATIAVGMLIFPRAEIAPAAFDRYTEEVRRAERARCRAEGRQDLVMAAFHPQAADSFETPYQLVSFVRRSPDPMIQLVRAELLENLRVARPTLSEDLAQQNFATVNARGASALDAILRDIRRDRDETYAALPAPGAPL
jgi:hypothetical protein